MAKKSDYEALNNSLESPGKRIKGLCLKLLRESQTKKKLTEGYNTPSEREGREGGETVWGPGSSRKKRT